MSFVCQVAWVVKPGNEQIVKDAIIRLGEASRLEAGNQVFQPYFDPEDPSTLRIFEVYDTQESFDAHGKTDYFRELVLETAIPRLESRVRTFYSTIEPDVTL